MGLFSPELSTKTMVPLCRQLATSYEAGIPIVRGLALVSEQLQDRKARRVMVEMMESVQAGSTLGDAARKQRGYLPHFFIALLESGESGGRLDVMLRDLAQYYEDRLAMRRAIIGALTYPILQLAAAWFLGTFALRLVGQLDPMSMQPFDLGAYFAGYVWFQVKAMLVLGVLFLLCAFLSYIGVLRWIWGWFAYNLWPFNQVSRRFALARFFRSMSLLIGSGMHIRLCIEHSAVITLNPYVERDLRKAVPVVAQGGTLVEAFAGSKVLTRVAREMIHVGEETGKLEESLRKVSEYHMDEATHAVKVATRVLGVAIILVMALLIGYIVISFYANLYGNLMNIS